MKKVFTYLFVSAAVLTLGSCSKFLDKPAQGQMTEEDFLDSGDAVSSLTNSIYEVYRCSDTYSSIGLYIPDLASDNALRGSQMSDGGGLIYNNATNQFQNLSGLNGGSAFIGWVWNNCYKGIGRANTVLKTLETFPDIPDRQREVIEAEARFNRAYFYFMVLRMWGKGPIVPLEELTGAEQANLPIANSSELYEYIIADLRYALNMPDKEESAQWYSTSWYGRAHKGSAQGLLAKVLLYEASDNPSKADDNYAEIVQIVKDMESSTDGYDLINFNILFAKSGEYSAESVFEIGVASFPTGGGSHQAWQLLGSRGEPNWGWGFIAPSLYLVQSFEPNDVRKEWTITYGQTTRYSGMEQTPTVIDGTTIIGQLGSATSPTGYGYPNRYTRKAYRPRPVTNNNDNYGGNIRVMRWAEVLLIGAEAAVEIGDSKAQEWLDEVRTRAGLTSVSATLDNIWNEKRLELCMECDRWFDMVRIDKKNSGYFATNFWKKIEAENQGLAYMKENHPDICPAETTLPLPPRNPVEVPKHYVMPVPNEQILLMNNLKQNDGY